MKPVPPMGSVYEKNLEDVLGVYRFQFRELVQKVKRWKDKDGFSYIFHIIERGEMLYDEFYKPDNEKVFQDKTEKIQAYKGI